KRAGRLGPAFARRPVVIGHRHLAGIDGDHGQTPRAAGFETDTNEMYLIGPDGNEEHVPLASKPEVGRRIVAAVARRLGSG
ncbi:MAG: hypothetical protein ACOC2D_08655, partial [Spirochaetota bacterium]